MKTLIEFDYKKATQAINFFACKSSSNSINEMKAIKLIWLADRYHIRKYGRPIVGDDYKAMPYGPVGSTVKDIAEKSDFLAEQEREYADEYISNPSRYTLQCNKEPDLKVFSQTDLEALGFVYSNFGDMDQFKLAELSHNYPEWKKFESELTSGASSREDMSYIDFFDNPKTLEKDKFSLDQELLEENKKIFMEKSDVLNNWN